MWLERGPREATIGRQSIYSEWMPLDGRQMATSPPCPPRWIWKIWTEKYRPKKVWKSLQKVSQSSKSLFWVLSKAVFDWIKSQICFYKVTTFVTFWTLWTFWVLSTDFYTFISLSIFFSSEPRTTVSNRLIVPNRPFRDVIKAVFDFVMWTNLFL